MRSKRMRGLWLGAGALALLVAGPGLAAEQTTSHIRFEANIWGLNGDTVRQPMVPEVQKVADTVTTVTDTLTVLPNAAGVTSVPTFPAGFGGGATLTVSKTTMGGALLVPNPTNRFDPFTGKLVNRVGNQAGTAMGPNPWVANVPVDLEVELCLDEVESGGCFFVANLSLPGAVGDPAVGTVMFSGIVDLLSIPIDGTARPGGFTTGTVTVMKQIITARKFGDPAGTPTGFKTFTFTSKGSVTPNKLVLISPIVVDAFVGVGPDRIPAPIIGFARATNTGPIFATPEPGALLLVAGAGVLALLGRRRTRTA